MSIWKLTIPSIEEYLNEQNDSLFADIVIPSGMTKATLVSAILDECDFYNAVYQDANFLKAHITNWFAKYKETFDKWYEIWNTTYNPLDNYNRIDRESEANIHSSKKDAMNRSNGSSINNGGSYDESENIDKVSAYDDSDFSNRGKNDSVSKNRHNDSRNENSESIDNDGENSQDVRTHKMSSSGNIGITTTQRLYREENELREKYNPYTQIADLFLTEFCIMVL